MDWIFLILLQFDYITVKNYYKRMKYQAIHACSARLPECPPGWLGVSTVPLGCLMFNSTSPMNWHSAVKQCQQTPGAHLVETLRLAFVS